MIRSSSHNKTWFPSWFNVIFLYVLKITSVACGLSLLVLAPFVALIKGSNLGNIFGWSGYLSLAVGAVFAFITILIYFVLIDRLISKKVLISFKNKTIMIATCVILFTAHTLFLLSDKNVKNSSVAQEYFSLHPILRLSVSTFALFDSSLVITDMSRNTLDYGKMNLPVNGHSLHYVQGDGFVHAVDIRTFGRSGVRNWVVKSLFIIMGFDVLRHVGTADHLHVSLRSA